MRRSQSLILATLQIRCWLMQSCAEGWVELGPVAAESIFPSIRCFQHPGDYARLLISSRNPSTVMKFCKISTIPLDAPRVCYFEYEDLMI